ncbi:MAG: hypothetical protein PHR35_21965 [Kiritimatiellae bacterium]|nr:hypothetical protein [Kiritimatiellia bacterium]
MLDDSRYENDAEHAWRLAVMAMTLALIACAFFAWAALLLRAELAVVGTPQNEKLKFFAGFLAILCLALPMLLADVLDVSTLRSLSYLGIWTETRRKRTGCPRRCACGMGR